MAVKRKLIEVSLPLETINLESAREKEPFTRNHPRGLHIWWARRPNVAARAILFAQLVDDPIDDDSLSEEEKSCERQRLHHIIERLSRWESSRDEGLLREARAEILRCHDGNPPAIIDFFAGGGAIPVEAQRLGLEVRASDLNPVAVMINKALIEIPYPFRNFPPLHQSIRETRSDWQGADGLSEDIRAYGNDLIASLSESIGGSYPTGKCSDGKAAQVISWIWARMVKCPNPACAALTPLVRTWWLSKKAKNPVVIKPHVTRGTSGAMVNFEIVENPSPAEVTEPDGTVDPSGARCLACATPIGFSYIRAEARAGRLSNDLMAAVIESNRRRQYVPASAEQVTASLAPRATTLLTESLPEKALGFRVQAYGMEKWSDLFTGRQLASLEHMIGALHDLRPRILEDAALAQMDGDRAESYADAIVTYLALAISRYTDMFNSLCTWNNVNENVRALFSKHAIPMAWDFAEVNPFGRIGLAGPIDSVARSIYIPENSKAGQARLLSAQEVILDHSVFSVDPPYYDNIGYADLSDFFYVWLRRLIGHIFPDEFRTLLTPKSDELVANIHRQGSVARANEYFTGGFFDVFSNMRGHVRSDTPMTLYYAYKDTNAGSSGRVSSGWETILAALLSSGWMVTATWPVRSERNARSVGLGTNALASSIVLSLRPRSEDAPKVDRRGFIKALQAELPDALRKLQQGAVAPVDLPQAAIGPGMAVFSRYSGVIEPDGSKMTVRSALARINEILDEVLNEQEGDLDPTSRFAIAWFKQHGYQAGPFGDADSLARARNTSVDVMAREEILTSRAGKVQLLGPADLPAGYDVTVDPQTSNWEAAHHIMRILESEGIKKAGVFLSQAKARPDGAVDPDQVKELGHLLYRVCEAQGWAKEAVSFNTLVTSWPDIVEVSREHPIAAKPVQDSFDFNEEDR